MSEGGGGCAAAGGDGIEALAEEGERERVRLGEDVQGVEGSEDVEGLEAREEQDADVEGLGWR